MRREEMGGFVTRIKYPPQLGRSNVSGIVSTRDSFSDDKKNERL